MGATVWGNKAQSNFMTIKGEAMKACGMEVPKARTPFHLYGKLRGMAEQAGWEVVLSWEQNAPMPHFEVDKELQERESYKSTGIFQITV